MAGDLELDSPDRLRDIQSVLARKESLRRLYQEIYQKYVHCLGRCPSNGIAVELGSGGGFAKESVPDLVTSDIIPYSNVDLVMDATKMPFDDRSVRAMFMFDVFHHLGDVDGFLREARRCLKPGGRLLIVEPHLGWICKPVLKYLHHEPCDPEASEWGFESTGPLSDANGAQAWIVFWRDRAQLRARFPELRLESYETHSPLRYWLAGGMRAWSLLPASLFDAATRFDRWLVARHHNFGSFADIELVRVNGADTQAGDTSDRRLERQSDTRARRDC